MNPPDKKISRLISTMQVAGDPKAARLLGLLVANGTVDLDLRFKFKIKDSTNEFEATVAQAIGKGAVDNPTNIMALADDIGEPALCKFFDWTIDGEHIASRKIKAMAQKKPQGAPRISGQTRTAARAAPTATLDTWVGLLCRNMDPSVILDDEALAICMSAKMPDAHTAIAAKMKPYHKLAGGVRLWSHARSHHQFDLLACEPKAIADMDLLMELSDACHTKRAWGKPSPFASDLDRHILKTLASGPLTEQARGWINRRAGHLVQGKTSKWLENDIIRMWAHAWMQANPGQKIQEDMCTMILDRRNADSKSLLEHYGSIIDDKPLFQALGMEAMSQRLLEIAYQRFRSKGNTGTLGALVKHIGWPEEGKPHILRLGLAPCGGDKSNRKHSLSQMAAILDAGGEAVWGDQPTHTAGRLIGKMHEIIVQGNDGGPGTTAQMCLTTLNGVLQNGNGEHIDALRFCGALSTYMVVQQSPTADRCLQTMIETAPEAEKAIALAGGKPLHEVLDDIAVVLKNSKKRDPFQAFKSMLDMRERTASPTAAIAGPRF